MYFVLKSIKYPVFALFLPSWGGFWDVYTLFFTEYTQKWGCVISHSQYALKGQKLLAQGIALGFRTDTKKSPWKGKSFEIESFCPFRATLLFANITQGDALG